MPKEAPPARASPLSFSRMRWYLGMQSPRLFRPRRAMSPAVSSITAASPTLKRTKRDTEMFSPSLAMLGLDQVGDGSACSP